VARGAQIFFDETFGVALTPATLAAGAMRPCMTVFGHGVQSFLNGLRSIVLPSAGIADT
jgi:hypothetical protein